MRTVAALFVDPKGVYSGLEDVEVWDEARDARLYEGPWPVVAHPPCARWSRLAGFTEARFGLKRGEDGGCFEAALRAVRTFGGVLEHPAYSAAWDRFGLPEPLTIEGWTGGICGGWSAYVEQGRYGLPVKKATWLYSYGCDLPELRWGYTPDGEGPTPNGEHGGMDAWRDAWSDGITGHKFYKGHRHDGMRSATPPTLATLLVTLARTATVATAGNRA